MRNRIAHWICNFALNHIATPQYRDMVGGIILHGLKAVARDVEECKSSSVSPGSPFGI